jgi:ubiquinone/menaquinone biosynthesis C-methylase UbiE
MNSKQRAQEIFSARSADVWSRLYERPENLFEDSVRRRGQHVAGFVARHFGPEAVVLDLGCGAGVLSEQMLIGGKRVVSMDLSQEMVAKAGERLRRFPSDRHCTLRGDCEQLPFSDARFDLAVCLGVISFLAQDDLVLAELRRVLRPDGTLVLAVRNRYPISKALDPVKVAGRAWRALGRLRRSALGAGPRESRAPETPRFYHIASLVETLRRHGFEVFEETRIGYGPFTIGGRSFLPLSAQVRLSELIGGVAALPGLSRLPSMADLCVLAARAATGRPGTQAAESLLRGSAPGSPRT